MDIKTLIHYLRLYALPKFGLKSLKLFCEHFNCSLQDLHKTSHVELEKAGWSSQQITILSGNCSQTEVLIKRAFAWQDNAPKREIIFIDSPEYPEALKQTASPPIILFSEGNKELLHRPKLAVVGTRAPTQYAYDALNQLLPPLVHSPIATVSGLAIGVDAICHRISLAHNIPTIAVLGNGPDVVYPNRHQKLYADIIEEGLLISEFWPGTQPKPYQFPRRNRLISGISSSLLITEGRIKSGTMVSVKFAIEQNRDVLVVPCNITNINGELSHYLLTDGATPVKTSEDILSSNEEFFRYKPFVQKNEKICNMDLASDPLLDSVNDSATSVDLIAKRTGTPIVDVLTQLLEYELRGLVASTPEGYIRLRG